MATQKISEMTEAIILQDEDYAPIVQSNLNKKIKIELLRDYNKLHNKPTLNGVTIENNKKLSDYNVVKANQGIKVNSSTNQTLELEVPGSTEMEERSAVNKAITIATADKMAKETAHQTMTKEYLPNSQANLKEGENQPVSYKAVKTYVDLLESKVDTNESDIESKYTNLSNNKLDKTGNASNVTNTFAQASTLATLTSGEKLSVSLGKIMKAITDLISHIGNKSNPHTVTKAQVGLGNVDNTSDVNKPISTAVQAALDGKAPASHTHIKSQITDFPTSLPANGGAATTATKWATPRNINGLSIDGSADRVSYGTCSTAAGTAAKVVACSGFALITGAEITVKFTVTNTAANPTLNVNSTGAKAIYYRGAAITASYLAANRTYTFRYNGTQYELVGDVDTNTSVVYSKITDGKGVLMSGPMTPNPNILDNADFRSGIINQQNNNTYMYSNKALLTIDRWISYGVNVNLEPNKITIANRTSASHSIQQPLYTRYKSGDKVTLYVSASNITGNVYVYVTGLDAQKKKLVNGDNVFTFTLTSKLDRFYIYFEVNAVAAFNCLKLEYGEHFTGMPEWNQAVELDKCKYYFERINVGSWGYFTSAYVITARNTAEFPYKFSKKYKIPSIKLNGSLKILFYEDWANCTAIDGPVDVTKDQFRYSFSYPQHYTRANGTSCPISLVDKGNGTYIDIDANDY